MARRYGVEVFVTPTGTTRVFHPDISDEEWEKRHKQFERTCARFLMHAEEVEAKRRNEQMEAENRKADGCTAGN